MKSSEMKELLITQVMQLMDLTREFSDADVYEQIDTAILTQGKSCYLPLEQKLKLRNELFNAIRRLDVLQELLENDEITEIMINRYDKIFVEKQGRLYRWDTGFSNKEKLNDVIQQIVANANRIVNESCPIVDARLKDGSRVNVLLAPIAIDGSTMTIRKFPKQALTIDELIEKQSLSRTAAHLLNLLVKSGYNIFISGGTGSGKTTFLNALSNFIQSDERVITIEDSAELKLIGIDNLIRLEVRNANVEGNNQISIRDLIKSSLRMRPGFLIVGEVRGAEALDMLQALNTGHSGFSTGHANSAKDMLSRIETMVLMGMDMPLAAIRSQIASAIDIIVHLGRLRDRTRRVLEISEISSIETGEIILNSIFHFAEEGDLDGLVKGELIFANGLEHTTKLQDAGYFNEYQELLQGLKL